MREEKFANQISKFIQVQTGSTCRNATIHASDPIYASISPVLHYDVTTLSRVIASYKARARTNPPIMAKLPDAMLETAALVVAAAGPLLVAVAEPDLVAVLPAPVAVDTNVKVAFPVGLTTEAVERVVALKEAVLRMEVMLAEEVAVIDGV